MHGYPTVRTRLAAAVLLCAILATTAAAQEEAVESWPRQLDGDRGQILIYQPQIESYENNVLEGRCALSVTYQGRSEPVFGAIWFEAQLETDLETRIATLENFSVTAAKFPTEEQNTIDEINRYLETEIPQWDLTIDIDRLLASMHEIGTREQTAEQLNNDPPEIIFVTQPAVLVVIDGDPMLADMEGYDLKYVANTAFFVAQDPKSKRYYLKGGDYWYTSSDLTGDWKNTADLPREVQEVARAIEEEEKKQAAKAGENEASPADAEELGEAGIPTIIVRTKPAELVQSDGELKFAPLDGTQLLYVENTETDILMDLATQQYYILLSGRWYTSQSMTGGDWAFVSPGEVPADFANILAESDIGQVRASVAGTTEAKEAVLETQIPQTAEVDRKTATVEVAYDGAPKFEICTDKVAYALNTDKSVLLIDGTYYCCDQAVWFVAQGPEGPWAVAAQVPKEVQDLPPECPVYNVKYVYIYDSTPDVVYVGYTPGYTCSYVYYGTVVYGTGWWYRPWYHRYYYPRPATWGFHAHWNPVTGWGFAFGVSVGWLHIGVGRPWYGGWWGPGGYRYGYRHGYHSGYRHGYHRGITAGYRAGYRAGQHSAHRNMYKSRQTGVRKTGRSQAAQTARRDTAPKKSPKAANKTNNLYADKKGNVHRNQGGNWQQKNKGGWSPSKGSQQSLNRDQRSRQRGAQKSHQHRSSRSGGGRKRR